MRRIVTGARGYTLGMLPRRWVVERTFAWISKHRRCVRVHRPANRHVPIPHESILPPAKKP
jgi:transposase